MCNIFGKQVMGQIYDMKGCGAVDVWWPITIGIKNLTYLFRDGTQWTFRGECQVVVPIGLG